MPTALCATVTASSVEELVRARDEARAADLVELRLDSLARPDARAAIANRRVPVIVTCRPVWEGGAFEGGEEERHRVLDEALEAGAEFVDVEFAAPFRDSLLGRAAARVVVSAHDFRGVPADLAQRFRAMRATGAAVVKLAVMAHRLTDQQPVFDLAAALPAGDRHVLLAMGGSGVATRVLGGRLRNDWTYAGASVAPGQLSVEEMARDFRRGLASPRPRLFGVVGRPIGHSLSPAIHNAAFAALDLDACYLPLAAEDFDDFRAFADLAGLEGASVTAPFKRDALEAAAEGDELAARVGAANTLARGADGAWRARNTDVAGFLAPLAGIPLKGRRAAVIGAGGAARAVLVALGHAGARVTVHARRPDAARDVAAALGAGWSPLPPMPGDWDLLVNATPVGTWPDAESTPLSADLLGGGVVYDLVYNPPRTRLLRDAQGRGCRTIGGLDMLVAQAAEQFTWWTGRAAPLDAMHEAASQALRRLGHQTREAGDAPPRT
ncbi:MAG: type I 3-dehydroquinate dehydratase [Vicinamibacterales bacterium]|nr:type I 3-dehydroquinate dehydratase [Vicinamibacterales bacterium]